MATGKLRIYNLEEISLIDINNLIDKGRRFTLEAGLNPEDYDSIEEDLKDDGTIETTIH